MGVSKFERSREHHYQAAAPLIKNHLSIELSMGAGGRSWSGGRGGRSLGRTWLGEWVTVRFVLQTLVSDQATKTGMDREAATNVEMPFGGTLPVIRRSHASAHSRMTSMAYLRGDSVSNYGLLRSLSLKFLKC